MKKLISVVIPTYNEQDVITNCLRSIKDQSYKNMEIIVVDDGSTDKTLQIIQNFKFTFRLETRSKRAISDLKLLRQKHFGPGPARNLGTKHAKGEILVFVDADMTFDKNFVSDLVKPIIKDSAIGTFSKNEMVANKENIWSICWSINRNVPTDRMLSKDYPDKAPVFRAILKREFDKVDGFDATGEYTDDWSLSRKLKVMSTEAPGAIYYHFNPSSLYEVYKQARWIGKNEFISGNIFRRIRSLTQYSFPISLILGLAKSLLNFKLLVQQNFNKTGSFIVFKFVYDLGIWISVIKSFTNEPKSK